MHGPCSSTGLGGYCWCPHFGGSMTLDGRIKIQVVDDVVKTISLMRPLKRAGWRYRRDTALARWEAAGLKFVVTEGPGFVFSDPQTWAPAIPKVIRLVRDGIANDAYTDMASYVERVDGSVAAFTLDKYFWAKVNKPWSVGVVGHEVGHCLGLDHGGNGIMEGNYKPNDHDLASVREYYHR